MAGIDQSKLLAGLLAHSVHLLLLVLPTLALRSLESWDAPIVLLAAAILAAGILESVLQSDSPTSVISQSTHALADLETKDAVAMRVASIVGLLLLGILWLAQIESHFAPWRWWPMETIGGLALMTGIYFRSAAIVALGPAFISDIRCDGPLIQSGIYRWLNHPSEVGLMLIAAGAPLLLCSPFTFAVSSVTLVPFSIWRIRREDNLLSQYATQISRK